MVLPAPGAPATKIVAPSTTALLRMSACSSVTEPRSTSRLIPPRLSTNRRIWTLMRSGCVTGGPVTCIRLPSASWADTMGLARSSRRPVPESCCSTKDLTDSWSTTSGRSRLTPSVTMKVR